MLRYRRFAKSHLSVCSCYQRHWRKGPGGEHLLGVFQLFYRFDGSQPCDPLLAIRNVDSWYGLVRSTSWSSQQAGFNIWRCERFWWHDHSQLPIYRGTKFFFPSKNILPLKTSICRSKIHQRLLFEIIRTTSSIYVNCYIYLQVNFSCFLGENRAAK